MALTVLLFLFFSLWWLILMLFAQPDSILNQVFAAFYGSIALIGGIWGMTVSKKWGGYKSVMGRSIFMFSLGLLAQEFGQLTYSYYIYFSGIDVPYPSVGDIGYFGSILCYIYGVFLLGKATGSRVSLRSLSGRMQSLLLPLAILLASYLAFLSGYEFDWSAPLTVFLDFGYPFGQAIYVSIALLVYILSRKVLGGIMRQPTLILLFALLIQYFSDYTFLYQANRGTWYAGGVNDYMYTVSYFLMTYGLIRLAEAYNKRIKKG